MSKERLLVILDRVRDEMLLALHAAERDDFRAVAEHLERAAGILDSVEFEPKAAA